MIKYLFKNAEFVKTAIQPEDYPPHRNSRGESLPEIAVVGRSNVGKSTLLNHLFQSKGLVKTSSTPGKTQTINFFLLNKQLSFVDLPGYGYAQVAASVKKNWGEMIENYLNSRENLKLILFLVDIRRTPNEEDLMMMDWIVERQKQTILVLTKVDKVTKNERDRQTACIRKPFSGLFLPFVHYSAPKNEGRNQLIQMVHSCLC